MRASLTGVFFSLHPGRGGTYLPLSVHIVEQETRGTVRRAQGVVGVYETIEERTRELAAFVLETKGTVRAAAAAFGVSKSTVHKDLSERLERFDRPLWLQVRAVLDRNKAERHIRGGLATRRKYRGE